MACSKSRFGAGDNQYYANYIDFVNNRKLSNSSSSSSSSSMSSSSSSSSSSCKKNKGSLPSFTPVLLSLSVTTSNFGEYSLVYVNGSNFLPNGVTFIQFGQFGYLPVTYYSSNNLSFIVPINARPGNYNVKVVNLYNGNFSPQINQSYIGNLNFSENYVTYTITITI